MRTLFSIAKEYAIRIQNGRTPRDIMDHLKGEMEELDQEVNDHTLGHERGEDGIVGEAIDMIQCGIDLILSTNPDITEEELNKVMERKCQKWYDYYHDNIHRSTRRD